MNSRLIGSKWSCFACMLTIIAASSFADTHYVDINCITPTPPYTNWMTAATNIQDAVDAGSAGDLVLVTNGVYSAGSRVVYGAMSNRVAITKAMQLRSVNGAESTFIVGQGPCGASAVRCVYLANGATLAGFTLTNGATCTSGDDVRERSGGGVWCEIEGIVSNCTLIGNAASDGGGAYSGTMNKCTLSGNFASNSGGGVYDTTMNNCILVGNSAISGGGAFEFGKTLNNCVISSNYATYGGGVSLYSDFGGNTLNNCTLTGNSASLGGGVYAYSYNTLNNCIIYYNTAIAGPNYYTESMFGSDDCTLNYCCTTPAFNGTGNITDEPHLVSTSHISSDSPCVGKGGYIYMETDTDGEFWRSPPSIGADEPYAASATGELAVSIGLVYTNIVTGFDLSLTGQIEGRTTRSAWNFGDGFGETNQPFTCHSWTMPGLYEIVFTAFNVDHPEGIASTTIVSVVKQPIYYVNVSNTTPAYPYISWETAATNIQQAIVAGSMPGRLVLVTNGVYDSGGTVVRGSMLNRVALTGAVKVCSVNGPKVTIIKGRSPIGSNAVRCVYIEKDCILTGFTLTNGATCTTGEWGKGQCGGGLYCDVGAVVSNCLISGNSCYGYGGGTYGGLLIDCTLTGNSTAWDGGGAYGGFLNYCKLTSNSADKGGGACKGILSNCTLSENVAFGNYNGCGGGAYECVLKNCILISNSADNDGGGTYDCTLNNCMLTDNCAKQNGGGAYMGTLNNCTLTCNTAGRQGGGGYDCSMNNCTVTGNSADSAGGAEYCLLNNCIIYYNTAYVGPNYLGLYGSMNYCCSTPLPDGGIGNFTNEPCMVSTTHIAANSPCMGKGTELYLLGKDIDGDVWRSPPSIGADEPHAAITVDELSVAIVSQYTNVSIGLGTCFIANIRGGAARSSWDFGDNSTLTNRPYVSHAWATTGLYHVVLTAWSASETHGVSSTAVVSVVEQPVYYVNVSNTTPSFPHISWETAATSIQEAISAGSLPGRLVLVTNGVYDVGDSEVWPMRNRVVLTNAVTVRSVGGPMKTIIKGIGPMGGGAMRCAYVGKDCVLSGFMLTNGATIEYGEIESSGGAVWCEYGAIVSNCYIFSCSSFRYGGGAFGGTLNNCILAENVSTGSVFGSFGGGAYMGTLNNCALYGNFSTRGGGASECTLNNCTLTGNRSEKYGGGAYGGTLYNCVLTGNSSGWGGGADLSGLVNCTITGNIASNSGGGVNYSSLINSIIYFNIAPTNSNYSGPCSFQYCCMPSTFASCITNPPMFQNASNGNYHLSAISPCINAGRNDAWMFQAKDLDGAPRIRNGTVDMGAYEFAFEADLKGLLQGTYSTNSHVMATSISANLPSKSPFAADVRMVASVPSNTVDWALVEVLDTNRNTLASLSVFIDPQGRVTDTSGSPTIPVEVSAGSYYLALRHRNHLAAVSALPVAFTNTVVSYDFTTGADKIFGGTNACVELEPGVWGLRAGDADGDGRITPVDREIVRRQRGMSGYLQGDLNLDGKVDGKDQ